VRGPLSEQDLTDYALNELQPEERIYVESMLAASEECRNDVCESIEMARLLEQGYEREFVAAEMRELSLKPEQRSNLTRPHFTFRYILRDVASALALAACVAFTITKLDSAPFIGARIAAAKVHDFSTEAAGKVNQAVQANDGIDLAKALASLREMAEESSKLIPTSADGTIDPPAICTPPTLILESAQLATFGDMMP
jgi:anti-sigma factor RsiW